MSSILYDKNNLTLGKFGLARGEVCYQVTAAFEGKTTYVVVTADELLDFCIAGARALVEKDPEALLRFASAVTPPDVSEHLKPMVAEHFQKETQEALTSIMGTLGALESQLLVHPFPIPGALSIIGDAQKEFAKLQEGE